MKQTYFKMYCRLSQSFYTSSVDYYWDCASKGNYLALPTNYTIGQASRLKEVFKQSIWERDLAFQKQKGFHPIGLVIELKTPDGVRYGCSVKSSKDNWDNKVAIDVALGDLKGSEILPLLH